MSHDRLYSFSWNPMATTMMCFTVANDLYLWWSVIWHRNVSFRWVYHHAQQTWQASKVFFLFRFPHEQSSTTFCPCIFLLRRHKRAHALAKLKPGRSQGQENMMIGSSQRWKESTFRSLPSFARDQLSATVHISRHRSSDWSIFLRTESFIHYSETN